MKKTFCISYYSMIFIGNFLLKLKEITHINTYKYMRINV